MHAVYYYLMHVEEEEGRTLGEVALSLFEPYSDAVLDENNWWAPIDLITKDGVCHTDFGKEHVSDRYESPKKMTWEEATRYALDCVTNDMELYDRPYFGFTELDEEQKKQREAYNKLSFDEVVKAVTEIIPARISKMYEQAIGKQKGRDFDLENYRRFKLVKMYEKFLDSEVIPFTKDLMGGPNWYRAFDLTNYYAEGEPNAILRLDIHT